MTSSFQYIKDHIDAQKMESQKKSDKAKEEKKERDHKDQIKKKLCRPYSQMVLELLTELKNLCYPLAQVYDYSDAASLWWIGTLEIFADRYGSREEGMVPRVKVELKYDKHNNRATEFSCYRVGGYEKRNWWGGKKYVEFGRINCGLSREELLVALKRLHPSDSL